MSSHSDFEPNWYAELELALLEDADLSRIRSLCANRPLPSTCRAEVWRLLLSSSSSNQRPSHELDQLFDLAFQDDLHRACQNEAQTCLDQIKATSHQADASSIGSRSLEDDEEEDLLDDLDIELPSGNLPAITAIQLGADFECILTCFLRDQSDCVTRHYSQLLHILSLLYQVLQPPSRNDLNSCFHSLCNYFDIISLFSVNNDTASTIFHNLISYHSPEISSLLSRLDEEDHNLHLTAMLDWMQGLFTDSHLARSITFLVWDVCMVSTESPPVLKMLFITLTFVLNLKSILGDNLADCIDYEHIKGALDNQFAAITADDVVTLAELAQTFFRQTPRSALQRCHTQLSLNDTNQSLVINNTCLLTSTTDLFAVPANDAALKYFLVDCRSASDYNAGHLDTAFFLDTSNSLLANNNHFDAVVQTLLSSQQRAIASGSQAAGQHIVLLTHNSNVDSEEASNHLAHIVDSFRRLKAPYVSVLSEGFAGIHQALSSVHQLEQRLVNHDTKACPYCSKTDKELVKSNSHSQSSTPPTAPSHSITLEPDRWFSKVSALFTAKPAGPGKPAQSQSSNATATPCKSTTVTYRNTSSVFDEDDQEEEQENDDDKIKALDVNTKSDSSCRQVSTGTITTASKKAWPWQLTDDDDRGDLPPGDHPTRQGGLDACQPGDLIDTSYWSRRPEVRGVFNCCFTTSSKEDNVDFNQTGFLVLVDRRLIVLRNRRPTVKVGQQLINSIGSMFKAFKSPPSLAKPTDYQHSLVVRSIALTLINRITSNRNCPEIITFYYDSPLSSISSDMLPLSQVVDDGDQQHDRLYLFKPGEAVQMIKLAMTSLLAAPS